MPLSDSVLKGLIITEITTNFPLIADAATLEKFADAIAKAVVLHIVTSAVVIPTSMNVALVPVVGTGNVT